jgi:hypothetical protein
MARDMAQPDETALTPAPAKGTRPKLQTPEIIDEILQGLAEGRTLSELCKAPHLPTPSTVARWARDVESPFSEQYRGAREVGAMILFDKLLDRAAGPEAKDDPVQIQRDKLFVDTAKWGLSKLLPARFGEKVQVTGEAGGPVRLEISWLTEAEAKARGWA